MEWLMNNWHILVATVIIIAGIVFGVIRFLGLSRDQQIANFQEWLKWAVAEAEKKLGSGTGQLKLRLVYDMAIEKFPWLSKMINFEQFSMWVDEALIWLNKQLESNKAVQDMVEGGGI